MLCLQSLDFYCTALKTMRSLCVLAPSLIEYLEQWQAFAGVQGLVRVLR